MQQHAQRTNCNLIPILHTVEQAWTALAETITTGIGLSPVLYSAPGRQFFVRFSVVQAEFCVSVITFGTTNIFANMESDYKYRKREDVSRP